MPAAILAPNWSCMRSRTAIVLLAGPPTAINATLYEKLNFNFIRDITPIGSIVREPLIMVVNPSVPAKPFLNSLPTPRPIRAKSTWRRREWQRGPHCRRIFKMMAGVDMVHVPYKAEDPR